MVQTERRDDGLFYVIAGHKELVAAFADAAKTVALCREQARSDADAIEWVCEFETRLDDGTRVTGEYIPAELPAFRSIVVIPPVDLAPAGSEDESAIMAEYRAQGPWIPVDEE